MNSSTRTLRSSFPQYPVPPENIVDASSNPRPRVFHDSAAHGRRRRHVIVEETVELRVEILRQQPPLRAQLQHVGKRLVEFFEIRPDLGFGRAQARVEFSRQRAQQAFVGAGMQPPHAGDFGGVFDQAHGAPRATV